MVRNGEAYRSPSALGAAVTGGVAGPLMLWALGLGVFAYWVALSWSGQVGFAGYDLRQVYLAGGQLTQGHPLYVVGDFGYLPSAALLVGAPLSYFSFDAVHHVALVVGALLVVLTVPISAHIVGRRVLSIATSAGVAIVAVTGTAPEVIGLENLSMLVGLLGAAAFLAWTRERFVLAGMLLGLSIAVKPLLVVLCVALLVLRRWRPLAAAVGVVVVTNLAVLAFDPAGMRGVTRLFGDLLTDRGMFSGYFYLFNSSIVSIGHLLGWPGVLAGVLRVAVLGVTVVGVVAIWRSRPEPARSLEASGLLIAGFYLVSSDLESHWLLVLVPFAYTSVLAASPLRWWPVGLGGVFAIGLVILPQQLTRFGAYGTDTIVRGFAVCLVVMATTAAALWPSLLGRPSPPLARLRASHPV
jgi:arabinofuranan 3-O-arabinosyltransferase